LLRRSALYGRWRAHGKGGRTLLLSFCLRRGALELSVHHHLEGGTLERRVQDQRQGKGSKAQARLKAKQEVKTLVKEEGRTKAKGARLQGASKDIFKGLQGIREGLLMYQVHLYMFSVLYILFDFYIHLLQTGFPHGGFSRVMLTKNLCVIFMHALNS
jgi:hypothetical protein